MLSKTAVPCKFIEQGLLNFTLRSTEIDLAVNYKEVTIFEVDTKMEKYSGNTDTTSEEVAQQLLHSQSDRIAVPSAKRTCLSNTTAGRMT
ncbi:hypothetical protein FQA39_LY02181 [Lamprigera yunnana]|nr:hypothetical protein FQA39_LY02181 [Lamprigera yunnana]